MARICGKGAAGSTREKRDQFASHPPQEAAGEEAHLVRVMPNTPCLVGASASAMCLGGAATEEDGEVVRALFAAVGTIVKARAGPGSSRVQGSGFKVQVF